MNKGWLKCCVMLVTMMASTLSICLGDAVGEVVSFVSISDCCESGGTLLWALATGGIDKQEFGKKFRELFIDRFYPRASALTSSLFNYFSADSLAEIYEIILPLFNEKIAWFYIGDKKEDFLPIHLDVLAEELACYLAYVETKNANISERALKLSKREKSIKEAWLRDINNPRLKVVYYDLVLTAFCYQIRRAAALVLRWMQDYSTLITMMSDPLPKARVLLNKLRGSSYHEQATSIFKNYEGVFDIMCKTYFPQESGQ